MSKITNFKCEWEVKLFIQSHSLRLIGSGSEGSCYVGRDKKIYKYLDFDTKSSYIIDEIITEDEIKLPSFAFPDELYVVKDRLRGYRTERVPKDLFSSDRIFDLENIVDIDFAAVAKAYKDMLEDIKLLSEENVLIYDLPFNLMFDGTKFTAIDTCGYKKVGFNPLQENIRSLNLAMEHLFKLWFSNHKELEETINGTDIDDYLHRVMKQIPTDIGLDRIFQVLEQDTDHK